MLHGLRAYSFQATAGRLSSSLRKQCWNKKIRDGSAGYVELARGHWACLVRLKRTHQYIRTFAAFHSFQAATRRAVFYMQSRLPD
jgi:hypothetical protein